MKAITIRQPWASCIAVAQKLVENRGRPIGYRGQIAIHAGKTPDTAADTDRRVTALFGRDPRVGLPVGMVIAVANVVDCHKAIPVTDSSTGVCCAPWGEPTYPHRNSVGPAWHLVLADVVPLPHRVPARGALALPWTLPADVADAVQAQLGQVVAR